MAKSNLKNVDGTIVQPMDPVWLTDFLSSSQLNIQTTKCIITALKKYNSAVNAAGKQFEKDLKNCQNLPVLSRKPSQKK